jgi:hypothetical protein
MISEYMIVILYEGNQYLSYFYPIIIDDKNYVMIE